MFSAEAHSPAAWLRDYWRTPEQYILDTFARRDVVLLAEDHAIRHNLSLVQRLIPLLPGAGVHALGMEFGAGEDQPALDALLTAPVYDERLARRLMANYNVAWPYVEYMDVYRAAWNYNRARPPGARPFRVLNLSYRYDWRGAGPARTPEATARVFPKGGTEQYRAGLIGREILDRGEKLLALVGTIHALTCCPMPEFHFNAPGFVHFEDRYLGHLLHRRAPGRVATVLLHQPFDDRLDGPARLVRPANGAVDRLMAGFAGQSVGFDLATDGDSPGDTIRPTPAGDLPDDSFYASGRPGFRLADLADGYIYERPFAEYEGCAVDEAFLDVVSWPEVLAQWPDPHWHAAPDGPAAYWRHVRAYADLPRRYAQVIGEDANA